MGSQKVRILVAGLAMSATAAQAELKGYWDFEGTTIESVTGSTAGTLVGGATLDGTPIAPGSTSALSLNTLGDRFNTGLDGTTIEGLGHTPDTVGSPDKTILFWFNTSYTTADQTLFNYSPLSGAGPGQNFRAIVKANGNLRMEVSSGGDEVSLSSSLNDGNNHMIAFIFKQGDLLGDVDVYFDSTLSDGPGGNTRLIDTNAVTGAGSSFLLFGTDYVPRNTVGTIDDVAIFNEALSLAQLDSIRVNGIPEPGVATLLGALAGLSLLRRRR